MLVHFYYERNTHKTRIYNIQTSELMESEYIMIHHNSDLDVSFNSLVRLYVTHNAHFF